MISAQAASASLSSYFSFKEQMPFRNSQSNGGWQNSYAKRYRHKMGRSKTESENTKVLKTGQSQKSMKSNENISLPSSR